MFAGSLLLVLDKPGGDELAGERFEVLIFEAVRLELVFEAVAHLFEGMVPVEELEDVVFLLVEAVVAQADGVLDDVERLAFVFLGEDLQVGADLQPHRLSSFRRIVQVFGGFRVHMDRDCGLTTPKGSQLLAGG